MQFQFLLVRLKVTPRIDYSQGNEISIPFGAIKSDFRKDAADACCAFQFLLVRLKVRKQCAGKRKNGISIPFGAIKSFKSIF